MMHRICDYCGTTFGHTPGEGVTSGPCPRCFRVVMEELDNGGTCDPDTIRSRVARLVPACQRSGGL